MFDLFKTIFGFLSGNLTYAIGGVAALLFSYCCYLEFRIDSYKREALNQAYQIAILEESKNNLSSALEKQNLEIQKLQLKKEIPIEVEDKIIAKYENVSIAIKDKSCQNQLDSLNELLRIYYEK